MNETKRMQGDAGETEGLILWFMLIAALAGLFCLGGAVGEATSNNCAPYEGGKLCVEGSKEEDAKIVVYPPTTVVNNTPGTIVVGQR
jgi:hypothetical protein